jgi:uncharacterized protein YjbI with pentapeptide repeats
MTMRGIRWVAWGLAAILAVMVLGGIGLLGVRLRPYCVARFWGENAELARAELPRAPLSFAVLRGANLVGANLAGADLEGAVLSCTPSWPMLTIPQALSVAHLAGANLTGANVRGVDFRLIYLARVNFTGAVYDTHTRWPKGFDPQKHGAVLIR